MLVTGELRPARTTADTLVVVIHGMSQRILATVPDVLAERLPSADILLPRYNAGRFSNLDPVEIAARLSNLIEKQYERGNYRQVILVGHSRGALMARKAYVLARGETSELARGGLTPAKKTWPAAVTRIVLLAGLNRGWSHAKKPPGMSWPALIWWRLLAKAARLTGAASLLRGIERGAPFVVNLRVQWIRLARREGMPLTVQILGDMDDVVAPGDNIDLQAGQHFVYLNAPPGTTHSNIVEMSDPARREVFLRAVDGQNLKTEYVMPPEQTPVDDVTRVVFIAHGIRDFGGWTAGLGDAFKAEAARRGLRLETTGPSYGFFPMTKFLLFWERQKNVLWFMDRYTEVLALYPKAEPMDFVGHSNGTYLLGSALQRYRSSTFGRVVCAGSVLPRDFEWDEMVPKPGVEGRIKAIRSYVASRDWVVGIFPNLFDGWTDIGGGGFLGFLREPAVSSQYLCVSGSHGGAIVADNFDSIIAFVLDGRLVPPPERLRAAERSKWVELFSKLDWAIWGLLVAAVVAIGWSLVWAAPLLGVAWWLPVGIYVLLLLLVLNTL